MTTTRDLIDALISGDSLAIETTFDDVMSQKVSAALDGAKEFIAQNMFNPAADEPEEPFEDSTQELNVDSQ